MKKEARYLVPNDYMADPSVHVFNGRLYIYPSHDWESGVPENDNGDHFNMKDYHVFSTDDVMNGEIVDHGVVLKTEDIPWAGRQLWDCDVAYKNGKYYMYFPLKDRNDIFRLGVAISDKPEGPFIPEANPIWGSYSIDPAVFCDEDGSHYIYFGGIWGGQLQRYRDNKALESAYLPEGDEPAIPGRIVKLRDDMMQFAEDPRPVRIVDAQIQRQILLVVFYGRYPLPLLCYGRQPLRTVHLSRCNPDPGSGLDYPSCHRGIQRQMVSLPS